MSEISIDRASIKRALKQSKFPDSYDLDDIADALEQDVKDALRARDVRRGTFVIKPGSIQYDITDDGIKPVKFAKKRKKTKSRKIINWRNRK